MSYCRWSTDSDIYAYSTNGGFTIHSYQGTVDVQTLQQFKDKLLELKDLGQRVPKYTFDRIEKEILNETV